MSIVTTQLLAEIPLFSNMDEEERSELRSLMTERIFQPGQVVMKAGEPGGTFQVIEFHTAGEPLLGGVPLISSIIVAAILVFVWIGFAYRRVRPYYSRIYRRGGYVRRPRRRLF